MVDQKACHIHYRDEYLEIKFQRVLVSTSFKDHLSKVRSQVVEISTDQLVEQIASDNPPTIIDVREQDEHAQGIISGAHLIPRGRLELKIEKLIPDRKTPIAIYCAGGTRSVLAAHTLSSFGYKNVVSVAGGFSKYAQSGHSVEIRRALNPEQSSRYSRHLNLPEVGEKGQLKLLDAKVLCIGAGGLGSPAALYLAAAGIGTLGIIDADYVDISNLQRQILHTESRLGLPKVKSAEAALSALNGGINITTHHTRLSSDNVMEIFSQYDVIVDGSDNFATRYLANDACVMLNKPNVHGSIFRFDGQTTVFHPGQGPCYRCLYPEPPPPEASPNCEEAGVLGVLPGVIGVIQAIETIKLVLKTGTGLTGRLLTFDALAMQFTELKINADKNCPVCGQTPSITELIDYEEFCSKTK